jgi:hypothetical protein
MTRLLHDARPTRDRTVPGRRGSEREPTVGDEVRAADGTVGRVDNLLHTETDLPRYMIVATGRFRRRYPVIACGLITEIEDRVVRVRGRKNDLQRQPEALPVIL